MPAFLPRRIPVPPGEFRRRCWHLIGPDTHPVAAELRARSAPPESARGTAILLGAEFGWEDNARLLDGIAAACRDGGRLALVHLGAGGASLLRAAAKEDPALDVRCVELSAEPSARAIRVAVSLLNSEGTLPSLAQVGDDGRITTTGWCPAELPPVVTGGVRPGRSVVVTGGLGGLGLRAAVVLSKVYGLHPILIDVLEPAQLPPSSARHLSGLSATVLTADVTDRHGIARLLSTTDAPPVGAVVHCAGLLTGGPVATTTTTALVHAQRVKVAGLEAVLAAIDPAELRQLITFGSITAEEPHRSLGCYGLANELLRRSTIRAAAGLPRCSTVAAQWSLWSGAGMAQQAGAIQQARRMGMTPLPLRAGMDALVRLFGWPPGPADAAPVLLYGG